MTQVKRVKLKQPVINFFKKLGLIFVVLIVIFLFYSYQVSLLTNIGYSKDASNYILFHNMKKYILSVGENKTLNAALESDKYNEKYIEKYQNIKYFEQNNFIDNIHALLKRGYSVNNINMIFEHGNSEEVTEFAKRDKVKYLEEFYSVPYAKLKYYDRYLAYSDETGEDDSRTVLIVNMDLDKEDYTEYKDVTEFSTAMLVNKHRKLSDKFTPPDLVDIESTYTPHEDLQASKLALNAFKKMHDDAEKEGYGLVINSAYRSYQDQVDICESYKNLYGSSYVERYVAQPGYSEHQTGLAFDIGSTSSNIFANSKEYVWMQENAYKYGFILRFSQKDVSVTGFRAEPWHYRYVGEKISNYIHENKITFEEYYAIFLDD